jgi:signal peptidase I
MWLRALVSPAFRVGGISMLPTLRPGDRLLVDRLAYHWRPPKRGEIVVFRHPSRPGLEVVKRVVGLPGERVALCHGRLLVDDQALTEPYLEVPTVESEVFAWRLLGDEYLVLSDNRHEADDSRLFGPVRAGLLRGPAWYRYWPPDRRGPLSGE